MRLCLGVLAFFIGFGCGGEAKPTDCLEGYVRDANEECVPAEAGEPSPTDTGASPDDSASPAPEDTGEPPAPDDPCDEPDLSDGFPSGTVDCAAGRCVVEAGSFFMGSAVGHDDECPVRQIELSTFAIDKDEVTWGSFDDCVEAGVCTAPPEWCRARAEGLSPSDIDALPVFCVTWSQARDYCAHVDGRLPTEAEWEKAARGTRGAKWPWGGAVPTCDFANFRFVSWYCQAGVVAVGSFENASPYGARDMVGNAWEWVEDAYDAEWYRVSSDTNPTGPTEDCHDAVGAEPGACVERVIRGGAFNVTEFNVRSAARSAAEPDRVDDNMGFRCAYDVSD